MTGNRSAALARLDVFVGEWVLEADLPGGVPGRSRFAWDQGGQVLLQRTEIPVPEAPDSLTIVTVDPETGGYTQHYFDSRGVVRLYTMTFADGVWTLRRETPDFSPLHFAQRFTGTFSDDRNVISGAWESRDPGADWTHDFTLTYRRLG